MNYTLLRTLPTDFLVNCKITSKNLVKYSKNTTFAAQLSYGVMVALQFLVLSVVVRIRLGQLKKARC